MDLTIRCPECQVELAVPSDAGGRAARCPKCKAKFRVPHFESMLDETVFAWMALRTQISWSLVTRPNRLVRKPQKKNRLDRPPQAALRQQLIPSAFAHRCLPRFPRTPRLGLPMPDSDLQTRWHNRTRRGANEDASLLPYGNTRRLRRRGPPIGSVCSVSIRQGYPWPLAAVCSTASPFVPLCPCLAWGASSKPPFC